MYEFARKIIVGIASVMLSELKFIGRLLFRLLELFGQLFPEDTRGCKIRGAIYKPFLKKCGKNFQVGIGAKLEHMNNIEIGNDVYIGHGCWISGGGGGIIFENEVMLGPYVTMISGNHSIRGSSYRFAAGANTTPIIIKFGSWLGAHSVVTAGVIIEKATLVGAGSVVTKNTTNNAIIAGVPAKEIKISHADPFL